MASGSKGIAWEKAVLDYVLGGTRPAALANVFFALFTLPPTEATDAATEATGGSYARVNVTNNATNFPAATKSGSNPSSKTNAFDITFPAATVTWGTIVGGGIYSASSGGTLFYWFPLTSVTIVTGSPAYKIPAGSLILTET